MESIGEMNRLKKLFEAYEAMCKPYCRELGLSVQAFEILLFIARRKEETTAQCVCKEQNIKPTLMSFHIEKLVQAGYIERQSIDGNRRSIKLVCTAAALPIINKGAEIYNDFTARMWEGVSNEERSLLFTTLGKIDANAERILAQNK